MKKQACPSCGATLGIPDKHERVFTCSYCGTVLEDSAVEAAPGVQVPTTAAPQITIVSNWSDPSTLPTYSGTAARGCGLISTLVTLIVVGAIGIGVWTFVGGINDTVEGVFDDVTANLGPFGSTTTTAATAATTPPAGEPAAASAWYLVEGHGLGDGTYPALSTGGVRDGAAVNVNLVIMTTGGQVVIRNDDFPGETTFLGAQEATIIIAAGQATVQFDP